MPIIDAANRIEDRKHAKEIGVRTDYARLEIDLGSAAFVGTNIEIAVSGSYLAKISYSGDDTAYFKIDNRHAAKIYANEFKTVRREYERLWLTNPVAQSGKKLILQIGQINYAEIEPDDKEENGVMSVARLGITGDGGVHTMAGLPGVGKKIEVLGYQIIEEEEANMAVSVQAKLKFETSAQQLWTGIKVPQGAVTNYHSEISGIKIQGDDNETLSLTNADVTAGSSQVYAIVFYRIVII